MLYGGVEIFSGRYKKISIFSICCIKSGSVIQISVSRKATSENECPKISSRMPTPKARESFNENAYIPFCLMCYIELRIDSNIHPYTRVLWLPHI